MSLSIKKWAGLQTKNDFSFSSETQKGQTVDLLLFKRLSLRPRLGVRDVAAGSGEGFLEGSLVLVVVMWAAVWVGSNGREGEGGKCSEQTCHSC